MSDITPNPEMRIALFQRKEIRRTIHNNEWWFVITDVVTALTDSVDPSQYLKRIRQRDPQLNEIFKGGVQIVPPLYPVHCRVDAFFEYIVLDHENR